MDELAAWITAISDKIRDKMEGWGVTRAQQSLLRRGDMEGKGAVVAHGRCTYTVTARDPEVFWLCVGV